MRLSVISGINTNEVKFERGNLNPGVYFYKLSAREAGSLTGEFTDTKKMLLIK